MIKSEDILALRELTHLSISSVKKALIEANGDLEKAQEILQVHTKVRLEKLGGRKTTEGRLQTYLHQDGKIAVMLEVDCESDFAANTKEFRNFCERVAVQIAAMNPLCISRADVPDEEIERKIKHLIYDKSIQADTREDIINRTLDSWYSEVCLLEQKCVEPPTDRTIDYCRAELAGKLGENVIVKRFVRWEMEK